MSITTWQKADQKISHWISQMETNLGKCQKDNKECACVVKMECVQIQKDADCKLTIKCGDKGSDIYTEIYENAKN